MIQSRFHYTPDACCMEHTHTHTHTHTQRHRHTHNTHTHNTHTQHTHTTHTHTHTQTHTHANSCLRCSSHLKPYDVAQSVNKELFKGCQSNFFFPELWFPIYSHSLDSYFLSPHRAGSTTSTGPASSSSR